MQNMNGFISIDRKILEWEWYTDINVVRLFTHLLLTVNWEDKKWQGKVIKRGQIVTSLSSLAKQTGLGVQSVRTCLEKLKKTKELTIKTTNKYTLISITNYDYYQSPNTQPTRNQQTSQNQQSKMEVNSKEYQEFIDFKNKQLTNNKQTNNNQLTTTKQINNLTNKQDKKTKAKKEVFLCLFEEFWKLYPKNGGAKKTAKMKYEKALREAEHKTIIAAVEPYKQFCEITNTPSAHAATWLNQSRWETNYDELINNHRNRNYNGGSNQPPQAGYMDQINASLLSIR